MKILNRILAITLGVIIFSACSTTRGEVKEKTPEDQDGYVYVVQNPLSLADILIRVPGVFVDERGSQTEVSIRGGAPLFVVDGMPVGRSYAAAFNAVNVHDIASVEVLKSPSETIIYGRDAAFGAIVIKTRGSD